jgi:hypothetical protein
MLKNTVQSGRLQKTIRRMRFACWKLEATDAHSEYIPFQRQQWLRERVSVLRYCALPVSYIIPVVLSIRSHKYGVIQRDGLNFVRLYFLNYTWYVNDLHNI